MPIREFVRVALIFCLLLCVSELSAKSQDQESADSSRQSQTTVDPETLEGLDKLDLFELTENAEESASDLRKFQDRIRIQRGILEIENGWAATESANIALNEETRTVLSISVSREWLVELQRKWRVHIAQFSAWEEILR